MESGSVRERTIDIILVRGYGSPYLESWAIRSTEWHELFVAHKFKPNFVEFQCPQPLATSWYQDDAVKLLDKIKASRDWRDQETRIRPSLFIAHYLGGLVVKQVLCHLAWALDQDPDLAIIAKSFIGVVLLGVPHKPRSGHDQGDLLLECLRQCHQKPPRHIRQSLQKENSALTLLANLFEESVRKLEIDTLSICPSSENSSKRKHSMLKGGSEYSLEVDEFITGVRETSIYLELDFIKLCQMSSTPNEILYPIATWFINAMKKGTMNAMATSRNEITQAVQPSHQNTDQAVHGANSQDSVSSDTKFSNLSQQGTSVGTDFVHVPSTGSRVSQLPQPNLPCFMIDEALQGEKLLGRTETIEYLTRSLVHDCDESGFHGEAQNPIGESRRRVTLVGLPGVGKTAVAAAFVMACRSKFDAIFWVNADSKDKLQSGFSEIARRLKIGESGENFDPISAREAAQGWLSKPIKVLNQAQDVVAPVEARWLLVLDNADDPKILDDYWPFLGTGSVLVTSRRAKNAYLRDIGRREMEVKELEPLSVEEGAELVRNWTQCHEEYQVQRSLKISQLLGGIPLALLQCANLVHAHEMTFADFLKWHKKEEDREPLIRKMESLNIDNIDFALSVRGTIGMTWAMNQLSIEARSVVDTLAFLDPDNIDEEILLKASSVDSKLLLEGFPRLPSTYYDARRQLTSRAYIKLNKYENQELKLHRSVQDIFEFYMNSERRTKSLNCAIALLWNYYDGDFEAGRSHNVKRWAKYNLLFRHLRHIIEVCKKYPMNLRSDRNLQFADLLNQSSWVKMEQGEVMEIIPFLELSESICEQLQTDESQKILMGAWHNLGSAGMETNNVSMCLSYTKKVLDSAKNTAKTTGVYNRNIASSYNQHAIGLIMSGDLSGAEYELTEAIRILSKLEDKELASSQKLNLGYALWLQGGSRLDDAKTILKDGLKYRVAKWGPDDTYSYKSGAYHAALGNVELAKDNIKESQRLHKYALWQYEQTLGVKHHRTADLYHVMARYKILEENFEEAINLLDKALNIWSRHREIYQAEIARSTFVKGKVWEKTHGVGNSEAKKLIEEATEIKDKFSGTSTAGHDLLAEQDFDELVWYWSR